MKIGIFGGTFNPIHYGHLRAAEEVREKAGLDKVIFIPSHIPPHKELAGAVPSEKRLQIVRTAINGNPGFGLSSFEVDQGGSSYSIKTIGHIRETSGVTPSFILGQDAFNDISTWYEAPRLFDQANFIVMSRPRAKRPDIGEVLGGAALDFREDGDGYVNRVGNRIDFMAVTQLDISSSLIRALCREGKSIRYLVPPEVEEYIIQERIYR